VVGSVEVHYGLELQQDGVVGHGSRSWACLKYGAAADGSRGGCCSGDGLNRSDTVGLLRISRK
jgi:hypothetical protein